MNYLKLLLLPSILLFVVVTLSSQNGHTFEYNNTIISIDASGHISIREELDVFFDEKRRGIFRGIPYRYSIEGKRFDIDITNVDVEGHKFKVTRKDGEVLVRIGDPSKYVTGKQTYVLSYDVEGAMASYEDHDEFFWNIIGYTSEASTKRASFTVEYPNDWADKITLFKAFSGKKGNKTNEIVLHQDENKIVGAHRTTLPPNNGISLNIAIPKGLLTKEAIRKLPSQTIKNPNKSNPLEWVFTWWNLIPISIATFLLGLWRRFENKDNDSKYLTEQFYPPESMTPAAVGTFYDHTVNRRDIISLLPYWGNQGLISIKPIEGSDNDMYFTKLKNPTQNMTSYERTFFDDLFRDGEVVLLSDLKEKFHKTMSKTASLIKKEVLIEELYDKESKRIFHSGWLLLLSALSLAAGITLIITQGAIVAGIGLFIITIFTFILHFRTPRLSEKGKSLQLHLKGLYKFLEKPQPEKMNELIEKDSNYLHDIYPYVLAFDLDQSWTSFQKESTFDYHSPIWYDYSQVNSKSFRYDALSKTFNVRTIEKVFYSAPPPAKTTTGGSVGGFSGGSAGGGFGGGSSGSW